MKKILAVAALSAGPLCLLAEGEPVTADSAVQTVATAVEGFADTALGLVAPIAVAFVAFFLLRMGVRIVKSIASSAK